MSISLDFNVRATGAPELGAISNAVTQVNEKLKLSSGELKIFDAALMASVKSGVSLKQALQDISQPSTTLSAGINKLAKELLGADAGFKAASQGAQQFGTTIREHVVSPLAAASGAIRVIEGQQSIRVVENLLGKTLGLGPAFQAAFPIFGAVAMTEMLGHMVTKIGDVYNAWDPVVRAQERALTSMKALNAEFNKITGDTQRRIYDDIENRMGGNPNDPGNRLGKAARYGAEARDLAGDIAYQDSARISTIQDRIAAAQQRVAAGTIRGSVLAPGTRYTKDAQAARTDLERLDAELENAQLKQKDDQAALRDLRDKSAKEQKEYGNEVSRKAAEERQRSTNEQQSFVNRMQNKDLDPVNAIYAARDDLKLQSPAQMAMNNGIANQAASRELERMRAMPEYRFTPKYEGEKRGGESAMEAMALIQGMHAGTTSKDIEEGLKKFDESVIKRIKTMTEIIDKDAVQGGEASARRIQSATGLSSLVAGRGLSGEALVRAQGATQLQGNDLILDSWKAAASKVLDDKQREELLASKILEHETKREEIQTRMVEELEQARQRQTEQFSSTFTSGIMSVITGRGNGGSQFGKQLGTQAASHIIDNVAKNFIFEQGGPVMNTLSSAGSTFNNGALGKIFGGILPISGGTNDLLAKPADKLNTAGDKLIVAAQVLSSGGATAGVAAGSFDSTSGFGIPGMPNGGMTSLSSIPGLATFGSDINGITGSVGSVAKATGGGGFLSSAATGLGSLVGLMGNPFGDKGGTPGVNGQPGTDNGNISGMGIAAAGVDVAVGAMTAIQQFKRGGAKGALGGTSAILGTAAALDPEPISKTILGATAAITGIVTSLLGDPKVQRANQISKTLFQDQYYAPEARNVNSSTNGGYSDLDRFGNVRTSSLSPYPQTTQAYGDLPYRTNVPGTTTSQFGGGPSITVNVSAMDSKSFIDHATDITEAVAHGLTYQQTKLPNAMRASLGMG